MTYLDRLKHVKAFVFDVDGVLTDGSVVLLPDGEQVRNMHSKDGYALQLAVKKGYTVAIITGGSSEAVKKRLNGLGVTDVYLGSTHKDEAMEDFMASYQLRPDEVMYMGDDIPDLAALLMIGVPCCPADAAPEIKDISVYIAKRNGGQGCVREIIEIVMKSHGTWYVHDQNSHNLAEFTW
jgi:3-deoxy-D-manno-octulosonate 8-phosphate phosphatase (KDO 8-P phosphatase)